MILSDRDIRRQIETERIVVDPFDPTMIQPASLDVRLGDQFLVFHPSRTVSIDVKRDMTHLTEPATATTDDPFVLHPQTFVLASTWERIGLPDDLVGRVDGKSSLGRLGLLIHSTAGFIDPGFDGTITLELANVSGLPILLYPQMPVGQISFMQMLSAAERPYGHASLGSKYVGQRGPRPSEYYRNFAT